MFLSHCILLSKNNIIVIRVEYLVVCQIIYLSYMYKDIWSENIDDSLNKYRVRYGIQSDSDKYTQGNRNGQMKSLLFTKIWRCQMSQFSTKQINYKNDWTTRSPLCTLIQKCVMTKHKPTNAIALLLWWKN